MSTPLYGGGNPVKRPTDESQSLIAVPSDWILAAATRPGTWSGRRALAVFVEPDGTAHRQGRRYWGWPSVEEGCRCSYTSVARRLTARHARCAHNLTVSSPLLMTISFSTSSE
jgi:hypothetical protein